MIKNVLLINPWIYDFAAYGYYTYPLGLLKIARILLEKDIDITFLDLLAPANNPDIKIRKDGTFNFFKKHIQKPDLYKDVPRYYSRYGMPYNNFLNNFEHIIKPDLIMVSSGMTYWYESLIDIVNIIKQFWSTDIPVIIGGTSAILIPDFLKRNINYEKLFVCKKSLINKDTIQISYLDTLLAGNSPYDIEFSELPLNLVKGYRYTILQSSIGCPYKCEYCASNKIYSKYYPDTWHNLYNKFESYYHKYNIRIFAFYDDALFINVDKRLKPFLKKIIADNYKDISFYTPNGVHIDYIDEELSELLYNSGFKELRLSLEGIDEYTKNASSNKVDLKKLPEKMRMLKAAGFKVGQLPFYILYGLPGQKTDEWYKTIEMLLEENYKIKLASYSPVPGSKLYSETHPLLQNNSLKEIIINDSIYRKIKNAIQDS